MDPDAIREGVELDPGIEIVREFEILEAWDMVREQALERYRQEAIARASKKFWRRKPLGFWRITSLNL